MPTPERSSPRTAYSDRIRTEVRSECSGSESAVLVAQGRLGGAVGVVPTAVAEVEAEARPEAGVAVLDWSAEPVDVAVIEITRSDDVAVAAGYPGVEVGPGPVAEAESVVALVLEMGAGPRGEVGSEVEVGPEVEAEVAAEPEVEVAAEVESVAEAEPGVVAELEVEIAADPGVVVATVIGVVSVVAAAEERHQVE